jgi:hypothetical protein
MAFISSVSEAPSDRLSNPRTLAALLPSQAPAAGLAGLAAFWRLGRCSVELAFFRDLGLPGNTAPVWRNVGAFGGFRRPDFGGRWRVGVLFGV